VWVDNDSDFSSPVVDSGWIEDNFYQVTVELPDNVYYVRVRARDNAGNESDNTEIAFRVDTVAPPAVDLQEPADGAWVGPTPTLRWTSVDDDSRPVQYRVYISDSPGFITIVHDSGWITENSWTTPPLDELTYYWKVGVRDDAGNVGDNSVSRSFNVDGTPPERVQLFSPDNLQSVGEGAVRLECTTPTMSAPASRATGCRSPPIRALPPWSTRTTRSRERKTCTR
jgi:hypothetical protein